MILLMAGMVLAFISMFFMPVIMPHVAATNAFSAAFNFRGWWKVLRANLGGFLIAILITFSIYIAIVFTFQILYLTLILCIFIPFLFALAIPYLSLIASVLFAQAYSEGLDKLVEPVG